MGRRLAMLIGTSEYDDKNIQTLKKPTNDVLGLSKALSNPKIGNFELLGNTTWINQTSLEIKRNIERFFNSGKKDDFLLLYFAGHGLVDNKGKLHLTAKDTYRNELLSTGIDTDFIARLMNDSNALKQLLILDCCFSGKFSLGAMGSQEEEIVSKSTFQIKDEGHAIVVLTATNAIQSAFEYDASETSNDQTPYSVFTRFIIHGLETGIAKNEHGKIDDMSLFNYVKNEVSNISSNQTPLKFDYNYYEPLIIGYAVSDTSISINDYKNLVFYVKNEDSIRLDLYIDGEYIKKLNTSEKLRINSGVHVVQVKNEVSYYHPKFRDKFIEINESNKLTIEFSDKQEHQIFCEAKKNPWYAKLWARFADIKITELKK